MISLFPDEFSALETTAECVKKGFDGVDAPALLFHGLSGETAPNSTRFKFAKDGENFYALFRCAYQDLPKDISPKHGNRVYRGECVELFIGDKERYFELDVSPYGVTFWALVLSDDTGEPQFIEQTDGFFAKATFFDGGYDVVLTVPFSSLKQFDNLYANAFRVENTGDDRVSQSLFPTGCKFHHVPSVFKRIR
jgi:hypothetical protein